MGEPVLMQAQKTFVWQSLAAILVIVGLVLAAVYFLAPAAFNSSTQTIVLGATGVVASLILWALIRALAGRLVAGVESELAASQQSSQLPVEAQAPAVSTVSTPEPERDEHCAESGAVQMLAILQRQGRLVDFLQEDLAPFEDAQIGAAVRSVHAGCKQALDEHIQLAAIYTEAEGSLVSVPAGFDAYAVRLSGNVSGEPPFTGTLRHRGWRASGVDLPSQVDAQRDELIVAAAEVEIA
jgi:hypothetical protein